jgi:alkanesulfonate monooxygenase SsuD/methylene tetrahydromethanopterin reductase-like flavin-dependent oxidoreductase (luciferase family)
MIEIPTGQRVYGIQLPIQAQSNYFVAEWERTSGPDEMARIAQAADEHGFHYVGVCDHIAIPESMAGGMGTHWADCLTTLGWLGGVTTRVHLLSHVYVLAYRHPLTAAKGFTTLDHLSKGRAIAGIGAGHVQAEFEHLGVDFTTRGRATDEALPIFAAALEPRPPIWIGGSPPAAIRRAGRFGDGWLPQGPSNAALIASLNEARAAAGRMDQPMMIGHITPFLYVGTPSWDVGEGVISGGSESIAEQILSGTAESVNQLQVRFKARSCDELVDQLAAFGSTVAPLLTTI